MKRTWQGLLTAWCLGIYGPLNGQAIDSLRIFTSIPATAYTTSLAEKTGWRLLRERTAFVPVGAEQLGELNASLRGRGLQKHTHQDLPGLSHLGFVYYDRRAHVFCLSLDDGLVVDLTARRQFRLEDWTERLKLKAALLAIGL